MTTPNGPHCPHPPPATITPTAITITATLMTTITLHEHGHVHSSAGVTAAAEGPQGRHAPGQEAAPPPRLRRIHDHSHDGHDHGWLVPPHAVLLLPVAIYFIVRWGAQHRRLAAVEVETPTKAVADKGED